jgi:hypothetical protein
MASSVSVVIALTWGGAQYNWSSVSVLVPLIVGLSGLVLSLLYESLYAKHPLVCFLMYFACSLMQRIADSVHTHGKPNKPQRLRTNLHHSYHLAWCDM